MPSKDRDARGFRLWHEADIKLRPLFGRYGVESGRHRLIVQNHARGMAIQAQLLRRFDRGPYYQSGPRALHGQADGRQDDRGERKSRLADIPA